MTEIPLDPAYAVGLNADPDVVHIRSRRSNPACPTEQAAAASGPGRAQTVVPCLGAGMAAPKDRAARSAAVVREAMGVQRVISNYPPRVGQW